MEVRPLVDVNKLRGKIVERGYSISSLSKEIGLEKTTFYRRLSDSGCSFTIGEIDRIAECLHLSEAEAVSIFFNSDVS